MVYVNVVVATPAAAPAPTTTPERSHGHANTEGDSHTSSVVPRRRVIDWRVGIVGRSVHHDGIVRRHIANSRTGLLDYDDLLFLDDPGLVRLLLSGFQIAFILGLFPHALSRVHHIALLCQKGIAQIGG